MSSEAFQVKLEKYADVLLKIGLNMQSGQRLLIGRPTSGIFGTPLELSPLVRILAEKAYREYQSRYVEVLWNDDYLRRLRFQYAPRDSFDEFPTWRALAAADFAEQGEAMLQFSAQDPELLTGQDADLIEQANKVNNTAVQGYYDQLSQQAMNWVIAAAPVSGWTERVLPDVPEDERTQKLWDVIFKICRVDQDDPIAAWEEHLSELVARGNYMNGKQYTTLKYRAPGTDLTVGLPENHIWAQGRMKTRSGLEYTANIPTEEIFSMPHRDKVDGYVSSSKPLNNAGSLYDGFTLTFEAGHVTNVTAKKNEEGLKRLIATDEGAGMTGEVALVPHSSPISQSGLLFYNTLYDENAANHIALGRAYSSTLEGGTGMSREEFMAAGGNHSLIHVDFMIGSGEMDIDGVTASGETEPVMRSGEWAFDV